jgi:hypothetical protein
MKAMRNTALGFTLIAALTLTMIPQAIAQE